MKMTEWPLCQHTYRYSHSPDITKTCGTRASAPCANCGKALCDEHCRRFEEHGAYGTYRLIFCSLCVKHFEEGGADDEHDAE